MELHVWQLGGEHEIQLVLRLEKFELQVAQVAPESAHVKQLEIVQIPWHVPLVRL